VSRPELQQVTVNGQPLQLGQREPRRQQLEADRRVAELAAQPLVRAGHDLVVIERQLRQIIDPR
jgi:hypothetical protein